MKHLFLSLIFALSFGLNAQSYFAKCVSFQTFEESDCQGCGLKKGLFAGLIVQKPSGIKIAIHHPFTAKFTGGKVTLRDGWDNSVTLPISQTVLRGGNGMNMSDYLNNCLCNPSTQYVKMLTGEGIDDSNPMMPVIHGVPTGGGARDVLTKVDSAAGNVQWRMQPKVYRALLTQNGINAPVAIILENTLGGIPVWNYNDLGVYNLTLTGAFSGVVPKVFYINTENDQAYYYEISKVSNNVINLVCKENPADKADGLLVNTYIEILVYP